MKLTLAITVFNRFELLKESYAQVIDDPRIDEVLIMDDCSDEEYWKDIQTLQATHPKIRVVRQMQNRGMMQNKADAIALSKNQWVIIFDSDNVIGKNYLDAIPKELNPDYIYLPDFAEPNFNYTQFRCKIIDKSNVAKIVKNDMGNCMLNTCNYLVYRGAYGYYYKHNPDVKATDTIHVAYQWLSAGKSFYVVPGMSYFHRVHKGSGFMADIDYNMKKGEETRKLIAAL